jgi:hypothetical protein
MTGPALRFRQIHLDFHTSEAIPHVAARFDPERFAETLERAGVNSVTCFARCHHGWLYYDSPRFPERVHPKLERRDLLLEQIEACHARGIRVPIYITVQWDHLTARQHPEWIVIHADGRLDGTPPFEAGFYRSLCVNTPYREFLKEMTNDVLEHLPVDGLFFDIVDSRNCCCPDCRADMDAKGLDPGDGADRIRFSRDMLDGFKTEMSRFVHECVPDCSIVYNAGHIGPSVRSSLHAYTHLELESLPSGGDWGYLHFPYSIRYARQLGLNCVGMTGKFHTEWGDFHSFKNQAALEFECFQMLAHSAGCSIGDQLHPDGVLCPEVYNRIGSVYRQVKQKEPWCVDARPVVEIGVVAPEPWSGETLPPSALGAVRMLQESGFQFDIVDPAGDLDRYTVLILPDRIPVDKVFSQTLSGYLKAGGKILCSFESGLAPAGEEFAIHELGVTLDTHQVNDTGGRPVRGLFYDHHDYSEYIRPRASRDVGLKPTEYALYTTGLRIHPRPDVSVWADTLSPFFYRHWRHFCSHRQAPSSGETVGAALCVGDQTAYFSHPMFEIYQKWAPRWCKQLVVAALDTLLDARLVQHNGPSTLLVTLTEQPGRYNVHLLHYIPERRCEKIDIIEDVIPLYDLELSVRLPGPVRSVCLVPQRKHLSFHTEAERVVFTVPKIEGHQMIELTVQ